MRMKLLDYSLLCLLAGTVPAHSQEQAPVTAPAREADRSGSVDCDAQGCAENGNALMRRNVRQRSGAVAPEADASFNNRPLRLPGGGVIWATEDPNLGTPQFTVSAPSIVALDSGHIKDPVRFYAYNNYSAFIDHAEVLIYRSSDRDLVDPLATVALPLGNANEVRWDGQLPGSYSARVGDELVYIARAYAADGSFDETYPRRLQLVRPEDVERSNQSLRDSVETRYGTAFSIDEAQTQSLVDTAYNENGLRQQNIAIYGSRIRIQGRDLPDRYTVMINGQNQPVDLERKLAAEYLVPIGPHGFDIVLNGPDRRKIEHRLDVDVSGRYLFAVALADVTASRNSTSGSIEPVAGDEHYEKDFIVDGRLAFYLKGKVKGKYLVTAQADTQEREVQQLFNGFWKADPQDVFRQLDPDDYYPVYGDDSTSWRDVDTQGRLYLRVDWDKNQALWGNYSTGFTGTEYGQYVRSLYGGALNWRSHEAVRWGDPKSEVRVFGSEAQTVPGHSEFIGTGGSLYYLKHTGVLSGSDVVVLEIRDGTTGRVQNRVTLQRGADYEIDAYQGRILLTRPLAQITRENVNSLTRDTPLDGYMQVLLVDYEYLPTGWDSDKFTAGFRGRQWFGEHVAVGGTWVQENRAGEDYELRGADLTLQAGRGTYLKLEHSHTESTSAPIWFSDNGGLSFNQLNAQTGPRKGDANAVEARANFKELGWTALDWSAGAWWRDVDAGFSTNRYDTSRDVKEYGAEVLGQINPDVDLYLRYSRAEKGDDALTQAQATTEWRINHDMSLAAEVRRVEETRQSVKGVGWLAALQYQQRFFGKLDLYGIAQVTLDDDHGRYRDNNMFTAGAKYLFGNLSTVGVETSVGDRGNATQVNAEYRMTPDHSFYGNYTWSTDRTDYDPLFDSKQNPGWTFGQRWRLSNQINVFNESQYLKNNDESGLAHTFGMDFYPAQGWNMGFTLQQSELDQGDGEVHRRAVSVNGGRTSNLTQWQSKVEWRKDTGAERRTQWVTTNRLTYKIDESWRIAGRFNYSKTQDDIDVSRGARFIEGNAGFAWRPWNTTRYALFGKYTYLYDVSALEQVGSNAAYYDQRSQILALEGVYMFDQHWELAGKFMHRIGEVRMGRLNGTWADSKATFGAVQVRYEFAQAWHSLLEYRWLGVKDGGDRRGVLVGIDRDIGRNFRIGLGYNFTDFSDDMTNFDYDHKGVFLNMVGRY